MQLIIYRYTIKIQPIQIHPIFFINNLFYILLAFSLFYLFFTITVTPKP